jgi:ribonucleoside-diphosphate reductase beta chain
MPRGFLGLNAASAKPICTSLPTAAAPNSGFSRVFDDAEIPFPWMSEAMDLKKEKNFFETQVIDIKMGGHSVPNPTLCESVLDR